VFWEFSDGFKWWLFVFFVHNYGVNNPLKMLK